VTHPISIPPQPKIVIGTGAERFVVVQIRTNATSVQECSRHRNNYPVLDDRFPVVGRRDENLKNSPGSVYQSHATVKDGGIRMFRKPFNAFLQSVVVEILIRRDEADDVALSARNAAAISLADPAIWFGDDGNTW